MKMRFAGDHQREQLDNIRIHGQREYPYVSLCCISEARSLLLSTLFNGSLVSHAELTREDEIITRGVSVSSHHSVSIFHLP